MMSEHLTNIVVVGLIVRGGRIFVARRAASKAAFPNVFELLGGHLDPGEQPSETLVREIQEELGVTVKVGTIIDAFTYEDNEGLKVEICYLCELQDPATEPKLNPVDHSEGRWIEESEIDSLGKDDEEVAVLRKAFKMIKGEM
jgi:mutator protein MutT